MGLNGHFVLLVVGKLHPQKNQAVCIDALRSILPNIPHAILLLAGSGPMESEHRNRARELGISEKVRFLGTVESHSIRDLYSACDVNLLPAVNQSWGLTPFEALSAGRLSIVSSDTGAAEIISEHDIGIVSDPTSGQFAEAILRFHQNPDKYAPKADKGRNFVQESLGWDQYAERVSEILLSVYGGSE
jgi:1,4-alpha-glucan branching enzyme